MKDKFKNSKIKEEERLLLFNRIKESTSERILGFSLCSDSVVLERHLAEYAKANKKTITMFCAENDSKTFKRAEQKLNMLQSEYFHGLIYKDTDNELFSDWNQSTKDITQIPNKLDFAWHDWCGPLLEDKIKTTCISAQFLKEGGLLAITTLGSRDGSMADINDAYMKRFRINSMNVSKTEKRAYLVPCLLNEKLAKDEQENKKGLKLLDAWWYSTSAGEKLTATKMLFYIFKVEAMNKNKHNTTILKRAVKDNLTYMVCHDGRLLVEKYSEGLR
jgi:hypothetical protein